MVEIFGIPLLVWFFVIIWAGPIGWHVFDRTKDALIFYVERRRKGV